VLDFGLARFHAGESDPALHVAGTTPLTREGHVVGTPEFMAPEQASQSSRTDLRSDIYSLGCTFYCLLTGRPPFVGASLLEVMVQHMQSWPVPVTQSRPDIGQGVAAVLERMLAKRPDDRYQQAGDVAAALRPWAQSPLGAAPTESVQAVGPPLNVYPAPHPSGHAAGTTTDLAAVTPATPGPVVRTFISTARAVFGCGVLFLVLIASMLVFLIVLPDKNHPRSDGPDPDAPHPGPIEGMMLVRLPAGQLDPSYAASGSWVGMPSDFEMSTTEVTRDQFGAFARDKSYTTAAEKGSGGQLGTQVMTADGKGKWDDAATWNHWRPDLPGSTPVVCVSWEDAVQFCNWLSGRANLQPCYRPLSGPTGDWECRFEASGFRLPTEAEWEYAARAGDHAPYPQPESLLLQSGWFLSNSDEKPHPVGDRTKNSRGLYDVWGNVWEWCWDWHTATPRGSPLPWAGPERGTDRVVRGGGWCDPSPTSAAKLRKWWRPEHRTTDIGFRVVRTVQPAH
jgi:formylglycine-generating enzyme required for sulfatase activity